MDVDGYFFHASQRYSNLEGTLILRRMRWEGRQTQSISMSRNLDIPQQIGFFGFCHWECLTNPKGQASNHAPLSRRCKLRLSFAQSSLALSVRFLWATFSEPEGTAQHQFDFVCFWKPRLVVILQRRKITINSCKLVAICLSSLKLLISRIQHFMV